MLNIRNIILAVVLVAILIFTVPLAAARTEIASNASRGPHSALELQEAYANLNPAIGLDHQDRYDKMNKVPIPSYRSPLDECYDAPLREASSCRNTSQAPIPSYRSPLDECFDVPLRELASCRKADQASVP
jgi:hypothetical protein